LTIEKEENERIRFFIELEFYRECQLLEMVQCSIFDDIVEEFWCSGIKDCQMKVLHGNIIISIGENVRERFVVFANSIEGSER